MLKMIIIENGNRIEKCISGLDLSVMKIENVGTYSVETAAKRLAQGDINIIVIDKQTTDDISISDMYKLAANKYPDSEFIVSDKESSVTRLIGKAAIIMMEENVNAISSYISEKSSDKTHQIMSKVFEYLENNYDNPIKLENVAKQVYVNPTYLSHIFKKYTGESFVAYLTEIKMRKAKELLKNPEYKVKEIGKMVGYSDPCYFSVLFKKHEGVSPNEYRIKFI